MERPKIVEKQQEIRRKNNTKIASCIVASTYILRGSINYLTKTNIQILQLHGLYVPRFKSKHFTFCILHGVWRGCVPRIPARPFVDLAHTRQV